MPTVPTVPTVSVKPAPVLQFRNANGLTVAECNQARTTCYKRFADADITTRETEVGKKYVSVSWGDGLVSRSIWRIGGRYVLHGGPGESLAYAARFEDVLALIRCW